MAIGQGGYKGNLDEIARSLESQSGGGEFVQNFMDASDSEIKETAALEAQARSNQWSDVGTSIMDWLDETAFEGSKNPQGLVQQALAKVSKPFRLANELTMDYLKTKPGLLNIDPFGAAYGLISGGFGIPVNKWATGEPVTKMDTGIAALTATGPVLAGALKGSASLARTVAPKTTRAVDESVDLARRNILKGVGATGVAIATGVGGAYDALKVFAPIAKLSKGALAVSAVTTGLAAKVMRNLHTLIVQTPVGGYPRHGVDASGQMVIPSKAMGDEVGATVSTHMAKEILTGENRHILSFVNRIFHKSDHLSIPPREIGADFEWKLLDEVEGYKDVTKVIGDEELDLVRINERLTAEEHLVPDIQRNLDESVDQHWLDADYAEYHMAKSADLSSSTIRFEEGLSVIDNLAKNDPAELARILHEVIDEAETLLAFGVKTSKASGSKIDDFMVITPSGNPMHILVADQKATIKMAKEILEALK